MEHTLTLIDCEKSNLNGCKPIFRPLTDKEIEEISEFIQRRQIEVEEEFWFNLLLRHGLYFVCHSNEP